MKSSIINTIFFCFLISCHTKTQKDESSTQETEYKLQSSFDIGFYIKEKSTLKGNRDAFFLSILEYEPSTKTLSLGKEKSNHLRNKLYISKLYGIYNYDEKSEYYHPRAYYEILDTHQWPPIKTVGKLHEIGGSAMGGIFLSDTTEQYGWFVVLSRAGIKGHPKFKTYPDSVITYTRIKSTHPKAKILCGNYERLSQIPYRIITHEEVEGNIDWGRGKHQCAE